MLLGLREVFLRRKKGLEVVVGEMENDERELLLGFLDRCRWRI
jgi:hypothetical protein